MLEVFLFPFWRDAGLLKLTYDRNLEMPPHLEKRTTRLHRVAPTRPGRLAFEHLSRTAPGREHLHRLAKPDDGRGDGRAFLLRTEEAGSLLYDDPTEWEE